MTTGTVRTQGTHLYFVDDLTSSEPQLIKLLCPTGITGIGGGAKTQIPTTCLDELQDETSMPGLGSPSPISVPFNFIPSGRSHQVLFELKRLGTVKTWMALLSDGDEPPTLDSDDEMVPPASPLRTSVEFDAYVSEVNIDIATNEIVRGTLTLQRSGAERWHWNGPVPA